MVLMGFFRFIIFKSNGSHCNKKKFCIFSRQESFMCQAKTKLKPTKNQPRTTKSKARMP